MAAMFEEGKRRDHFIPYHVRREGGRARRAFAMKQVREVRVRDLILYFYLQFFVLAVIWTLFGLTVGLGWPVPLWASLPAALVLGYLPLKYFLIGMVLMYKAYAPLSVRGACRFYPTCSTYMVLSIKKYGILVGVAKGLYRIWRCRPPNGGEDWP